MAEETKTEEAGETTPEESSTKTKTEEGTPASEEKKSDEQDISKLPLDQHPRWKEREQDWNRRFEEQSRRFEEQFKSLTPAEKREERLEIPKWFGGDLAQWKEYNADLAKRDDQVAEQAIAKFNSTQQIQQKALADANNWFTESIKAIETEAGEAIDRDALLAVVQSNELIDSKGRWNYKAAYKIMVAEKAQEESGKTTLGQRKKLAGATTKDSGKGGGDTKTFKTSEDFKKNRPW